MHRIVMFDHMIQHLVCSMWNVSFGVHKIMMVYATAYDMLNVVFAMWYA